MDEYLAALKCQCDGGKAPMSLFRRTVQQHNLSRQLLQPTANEFCRIYGLAKLDQRCGHRLAGLRRLIAKVGEGGDGLGRGLASSAAAPMPVASGHNPR